MQYSAKEGMVASLYFHTDPQKESIKGNFYNNIRINDKLVVSGIKNNIHFEPPIKKYLYKLDIKYKKSHARYLVPPFGFNLLSIIEEYPDLKKEITGLFDQYRLSIAFDKASQTIKVIQDKSNNNLFLIPYNSIADTLQRIIFYKTAIASNNNSVLLFEEPEAHSFPPYMTHITQEMIHKTDNQYFITTHSPFILNDLLENAQDELSVFMVYYEGYETKTKQLTHEELNDVYQNGVDLFTNSESFV
jgi:AAA15 family ATPase/GTPase